MGNGTLSGLEGKPGSSRSKTNRQRSVLSQLFNYVYYNYWESNWSLNFQISATSRSRSSKFELPLWALLLLLLQVVVALQHRGTKTTFKIIKPTRIPHAETTIDAAADVDVIARLETGLTYAGFDFDKFKHVCYRKVTQERNWSKNCSMTWKMSWWVFKWLNIPIPKTIISHHSSHTKVFNKALCTGCCCSLVA